jgi:curved DNA-binding protein CbpA
MIVSSYYYELLGVKPGASLDSVKRSFRTLVRKNHPDLFPESRKEIQELKMIQINEAYAMIAGALKPANSDEKEVAPGGEGKEKTADFGNHFRDHLGNLYRNHIGNLEKAPQNAVDFHRDIQYAYYKQGFDNFSRALNGIKRIERKVCLRNDLYYLKRFSASLINLRKADSYFSKLLWEYPESMWAYDAHVKTRRIEYFNRLYRKILSGIEKKLKSVANY